MRFSILIPVYNTERYLDECLQSVLQQSYVDFEVILTDDGSTDNSKSICEKYVALDDRIRFCSRANKGLLATRREQLKMAKGEYVLFLDSDDYWDDGILQELSKQIDGHHPDLICFAFKRVDDSGNVISKTDYVYDEDQEFSIEKKNLNEFKKEFFKNGKLGYLWLKCVRKSIIDIENSYDAFTDVYGEDSLQSAEIICNAESVLYLRRAFTNYRQSFTGKGRNYTPSYAIDNMCIRDYMYQRITAHHLGDDISNVFFEHCLNQILYQVSNLLKVCKSYKEYIHYYRAMLAFPISKYAINYVLKTEGEKINLKTRLIIQRPFVFYYLLKVKNAVFSILDQINVFVSLCKYLLWGWFLYMSNRKGQKQMPADLFKSEYIKYRHCLRADRRKDLVFAQMHAFLTSFLSLVSDNLTLSSDNTNPVVFVVVRNELERMKIFYEHYRKLGVEQFVVLDNDSDDGTLEFLAKQKGTRVYQVLDAFQTQKKEAWIEKLLVMNGLGRWCIVVDSDELLDYVGSEKHPINQMIQVSNRMGYKRIWGYMLDMYAKEPLFSQISQDKPFTHHFRFFDKESYVLNHKDDPNRVRGNDEIYGGPRLRVFDKVMTLSKQTIFFFEQDMLYSNCHFLYPFIKWGNVPCWFVLRHYKFLPSDKMEYIRRIRENCFYNNSIEYKTIMSQVEGNDVSMFYENSQEYIDSDSLMCLPFLEEIKWS